MTTTDKLVFISYRRSTSKAYARLIFERLRAADYDAFLDVNLIDSGAFDSMILSQIGARPHFVVLISPGALERCQEDGDWLRREIDEAMRLGRNVVPLIEEGVDFNKETDYLPEHLRANFRRYNHIPLVHFYFDAAMDMLINRFLKQPVHSIQITSPQLAEQNAVQQRVAELAASPAPTQQQLQAEEYLSKGIEKRDKGDWQGAIADYNEAVRYNPLFAEAYARRGGAKFTIGEYDSALIDINHALQFDPYNVSAYINRGNAHKAKNELDQALADYNEALRLNPKEADAYNNRGNVYYDKLAYDNAIADYSEALRLNPKHVEAYTNRGAARQDADDLSGALADFDEALRLNPRYADAYVGRGNARHDQNDLQGALADYQTYLDLGGSHRAEIEAVMAEVRKKLERKI